MSVIGIIFIILGIICFLFEMIGMIRYKYVLNRMHVAGMGDTLGAFLCILGLMFISGLSFTTLKFALVIVFLWFSSPTSSHLISGLEALTDDELNKFADVKVDDIKELVDGHIKEDNE